MLHLIYQSCFIYLQFVMDRLVGKPFPVKPTAQTFLPVYITCVIPNAHIISYVSLIIMVKQRPKLAGVGDITTLSSRLVSLFPQPALWLLRLPAVSLIFTINKSFYK